MVAPQWVEGLQEWNQALSFLRLDLLFRLVLAAILGGAIGLEREVRGKPHILFAESGSKSSVHPTTPYHCATCRTG